VKVGELVNKINYEANVLVPDLVNVRTVDEDGFIRDITGVAFDPETDEIWLRTEIKKESE